jgi:hypothetical protein
VRNALAAVAAAVFLAGCVAPASNGPTEPPFTIPSDQPTAQPSGSAGASGSPASLPAGWSYVNGDGANVSVADDGTITVTLTHRLLWFRNSRGFLMYREAKGDFRVTADVVATSTSDPGQDPGGDGSVQLGGLMVRDPASPPENYVHIVVGDDGNGLSVETKSTKASVSEFAGPDWGDNEAFLRVCRVGPKVSLYKRMSSDDPWALATTYDRADLPETLQAGVDVYTNDQPDITVTVSDFSAEPVKSEADCTKD